MKLASITVNDSAKALEVLWDNNGTPIRCAYSGAQRDQFLADVPDGQQYADQVWPNWRAEDYLPPPPTAEEIVVQMTNAVQAHLDQAAQQRGYDSILSACTYAASNNPRFAAEGQTCVAWRDAVWTKCDELQKQVKSGIEPIPTVAELIAMLPPVIWPEL